MRLMVVSVLYTRRNIYGQRSTDTGTSTDYTTVVYTGIHYGEQQHSKFSINAGRHGTVRFEVMSYLKYTHKYLDWPPRVASYCVK